MPVALHYLEQLKVVDVSNNAMEGSTPPMMLSPLIQEINASHNRFYGMLTGVAGYTSQHLRILDLSHNLFYGDYEGGLKSFPNLTHVDISHNLFYGACPFPRVYALRTFRCAHNDYTGTIPTEYGTITTLEDFDVSGNDISGSIPEELQALSLLSSLNVLNNPQMSGSIPVELCIRQHMGDLVIQSDVEIIEPCPNITSKMHI